MKKGSTAAAKQSRNFPQQTLTMGLDLGDRSSWYCVQRARRAASKHDCEGGRGDADRTNVLAASLRTSSVAECPV